jgi:hypothetical protein
VAQDDCARCLVNAETVHVKSWYGNASPSGIRMPPSRIRTDGGHLSDYQAQGYWTGLACRQLKANR